MILLSSALVVSSHGMERAFIVAEKQRLDIESKAWDAFDKTIIEEHPDVSNVFIHNAALALLDIRMILKDESLVKNGLVSQKTIESACSEEVPSMLQKKYNKQERIKNKKMG